MVKFNWNFRNRGQGKSDGDSGGVMQDSEPLEPITCAGCPHPIREGDEVILRFAVEREEANEASAQRVSWGSRLSKALLFYEGLEQLFGSIPQSFRDLCEKNGETIRHIPGGTANFLLRAGKKGESVLRGVPASRLVAGGAVAAVVVCVVMAGAIPAFSGRRGASKKNFQTAYYHINCPECGGGQGCY